MILRSASKIGNCVAQLCMGGELSPNGTTATQRGGGHPESAAGRVHAIHRFAIAVT
jgi:hypothetical protein